MNDLELGSLKQKVDDAALDISDIRADVKTLMVMVSQQGDKLDNKYYTRREGRAVSTFLGLAVIVMSIWSAIRGQ